MSDPLPPSDLLSCVEVEAEGTATSSVVWLHGLGADGHDFEPVVPHLGLPDVRFVFPHAPTRPVTINWGLPCRAWYDILTMKRGPGREQPDHIRASAEAISAVIQREVERGIPEERIVLAGFSQGAAMALHVGLRFPRRLAGLVILSGYFVLEETLATETSEASASIPTLCAHGTRDAVVPYSSGRAAWQRLRDEGRPVDWAEYPMGHEVCSEQLSDIGRWLRDVLEPTSS